MASNQYKSPITQNTIHDTILQDTTQEVPDSRTEYADKSIVGREGSGLDLPYKVHRYGYFLERNTLEPATHIPQHSKYGYWKGMWTDVSSEQTHRQAKGNLRNLILHFF